jgi:hypothetical protein
MVDLVNILLAVDSRQVKAGRKELDKFGGQGQDTERKITKSSEKMSSAFKGLAGIVAALGIAKAFKSIISATIEQEAALAQLDAAVKSTGGAAGLTSKELQKMASEMQGLTTFGDETVMAMQAVLLTFTKIGGETFPRASMAIADMAVRMGTDLKSAAIQVGKALNDPVLGITSLTRSGVQFSDKQKDVIKQLAETGRVAEAQALILEELETQFGGSAAAAKNTFGGAIQSVSNAFGDLLEADSMGGAITSLNELEEILKRDDIKKGFDAITEAAIKIVEWTAKAASAFGSFSSEIKTTAEWAAAWQSGHISFFEWATTGKEKAAKKLAELKAQMSGYASAEEEAAIVSKIRSEEEAANAEALVNEKTEALAVLYDERDAADLERLTNKYTNDQDLLINNLQAEQELLTAAHEAKKLTDDQYARLSFESDKAYSEKSVLLKKQEEERKRLLGEQGARNALAITDTLSVLMSSKNKEMFEIGKAAAIGSALINTYLAITKTMSATPYPWNIGLAAAQGLAGMVQVNNIRSQSFGSGGTASVTGGGGAGAGFSGGGAIPGAQPIPSFASSGNTSMLASALPPDAKEKPVQVRELRVTVESDGPGSQGMRAFAKNLAETMKDMGGNINMVIS